MFLFFNFCFDMIFKFILFLYWNKKAAENLVFCQQEKREYKITSLLNNTDWFTYCLFCVNSSLILFGKVWFLSLIHLSLITVWWVLGWAFQGEFLVGYFRRFALAFFILFSIIFKIIFLSWCCSFIIFSAENLALFKAWYSAFCLLVWAITSLQASV